MIRDKQPGERWVVVAAHPDDEALWFSSLLDCMDMLVICHEPRSGKCVEQPRDMSAMYRRLRRDYPLKNVVWLGVRNALVYHPLHFRLACETRYGCLILSSLRGYLAYRRNYVQLEQLLRPYLTGASHVFTHSPWGEYGHEEHIQLYRLVRALQGELGFSLWIPNYLGSKTLRFWSRNLSLMGGEIMNFTLRESICTELRELYLARGCWTWRQDWQWFEQESFIRCMLPPPPLRHGQHLPSMNMINIVY